MTKDKANKEEIKKMREVAKTTLSNDLVQKLIGGANVKSNPFLYGELGRNGGIQTYVDAKSSEDFNKLKGHLYKQALDDKDPRNPEEPFISDGEVVQSYLKQVDEAMILSTLGDLEKTVKDLIKKTGSSLNYELPDELKSMSYREIVEKTLDKETGKIDKEKLTDDDKYALKAHEELRESYQRACGLKAASINYFSDINAAFKNISEAYSPKEE